MVENQETSKRSSFKQRQKELLKQELLSAAKELLEEKNYELPSVDEIVARTGVAKGTFYLHFETKADIIRAILDNCLDQIEEALTQAFESPPTDAREAMKTVLKAQMSYFDENPAMAPLILQRRGLQSRELPSEDRVELVNRFETLTLAVYERVIRLGMLQQRYREVDAQLAARVLLGIIVELTRDTNGSSFTDLAELGLSYFERGITISG